MGSDVWDRGDRAQAGPASLWSLHGTTEEAGTLPTHREDLGVGGTRTTTHRLPHPAGLCVTGPSPGTGSGLHGPPAPSCC